jgi:hypothetical protein
MKTYAVVPVQPELKGGFSSTSGVAIEKQVADIINRQAASGWEFSSYATSHVVVKPGCLAALFGRKQEILYYDVLIFSRDA